MKRHALIAIFMLIIMPSFSAFATLPGDIDNNESIDLKDAIIALQQFSGIDVTSSVYLSADVDGDGKIGMPEVMYVLQCLTGLRNTVPVEDTSINISGTNSMTPSSLAVATAKDGKIVAVWSEGAYGSRGLRSTAYEPGHGWGTVQAVGSGLGDDGDAKVAMNSSGAAMLTWDRRHDYSSEVLASVFTPADGWKAPSVLDASGHGLYPDVTLDDSRQAVALWNRFDAINHTGTDMAAEYQFGGWDAPHVLASSENGSQIAGNNSGKVMAIWNQSTPVPGQPEHAYNTWVSQFITGRGWLSPQAIGNDIIVFDGTYYYNPQSVPGHYHSTISIDEQGNAVAYWLEVNLAGGSYQIMVNRFVEGNGWGTPEGIGYTPSDLDTTFSNDYSPITLDSSGSVYVGWTVSETLDNISHSDFFLSTYKTATGWTTEKVLDGQPYLCSDPAIVIGKNGEPYVLWLQWVNHAPQLWSKSHSPMGWSAPKRLNNSGSIGGYKAIHDQDGNITVIWIDSSAVWARVVN